MLYTRITGTTPTITSSTIVVKGSQLTFQELDESLLTLNETKQNKLPTGTTNLFLQATGPTSYTWTATSGGSSYTGTTHGAPLVYSTGITNYKEFTEAQFVSGSTLNLGPSSNLITGSQYSLVMGFDAQLYDSEYSVNIGQDTQINGDYNFVQAYNSGVSGDNNTVFADAVVTGSINKLLGNSITAVGNSNIALGDGAINGSDNTFIGRTNATTGSRSHIHGSGNTIVASDSHIFGSLNSITDLLPNSYIAGYSNTISFIGDECMIFGKNNNLGGANNLMTYGRSNGNTGENSMSFGRSNSNSGTDSLSFGHTNSNSGPSSLSFGFNNFNSGTNSITVGQNNANSGQNSVTVGSSNSGGGDNSTLMGSNNTVGGSNSQIFGSNNNVDTNSVVVGKNNNGSGGNQIFMFGSGNTCAGTTNQNFIFGRNNTGNTNHSFLYGDANIVSGTVGVNYFTFAYGSKNFITNSFNSFAFGSGNTITQSNGHSFGVNNTLSAATSGGPSNFITLGLGHTNELYGAESYTLGRGLYTNTVGQVMVGLYNEIQPVISANSVTPTDTIFAVGNGWNSSTMGTPPISLSPRSSAFKVFRNGNALVGGALAFSAYTGSTDVLSGFSGSVILQSGSNLYHTSNLNNIYVHDYSGSTAGTTTIDVDFEGPTYQYCLISGDTTFNLTNIPSGTRSKRITLVIQHDNTINVYTPSITPTVTFDTFVPNPLGSIELTSTPNGMSQMQLLKIPGFSGIMGTVTFYAP